MSTPGPARLSFTYRFTRRDGLRQLFAVSPVAAAAVLLLIVDSVLMWYYPLSRYPRLIVVLTVGLGIVDRGYHLRALGGYGLGEHTLTVDGDSVTYTAPTKSTSQPWDAWAAPRRRLGVLAVPLKAVPGTAVVVPRWLLRPEEDAMLSAFLNAFLAGEGTKPESQA